MTQGLPHRIKLKAFRSRYRMFCHKIENPDDCELILKSLGTALKSNPGHPGWAVGTKHVFLSEQSRQLLEKLRILRQNLAARSIQKIWRVHREQRDQPQQLVFAVATEPTSQMAMVKMSSPKMTADLDVVELTSRFFGLDLVG
jgi:myosin heavy subunit